MMYRPAQIELPDRRGMRNHNPVDSWSPNLFGDGSLADFLIDRWLSFTADLDAAKRRFSDTELMCRVQELKAHYPLSVPVIESGYRIVEHGPIKEKGSGSDPDMLDTIELGDFANAGDFNRARLRQIEAQIRQLSRTRTTIAVPFSGDGILFQFRPSGCIIPAPPGRLDGQSIMLRFERSERTDKAWQGQLVANLNAIEANLDCARPEIEAFNAVVAKALQSAT